MALLHLLLIIAVFSSLFMAALWCWQLKSQDASLVDVLWALSIFIAILYVVIATQHYLNLRHILIALCGLIWSGRLAWHLWSRIYHSNAEDPRYANMRQSMQHYKHIGFFIFFQIQALFVVIFSTPITIALTTVSTQLQWSDYLGFFIFIVAFSGEAIADQQLKTFKQHAKDSTTCRAGLWNYSRHPNYFFEWIHWFAYPWFSVSSDYFWITCLVPFIMLIFLLKLTGIPHLEREAIKNKPDYLEYIKTTSSFIPWFKKTT